jgi:glucose-6-phosphate isomerase
MKYMKPYFSIYKRNGTLKPYRKKIERRLRDMSGFFSDEEAFNEQKKRNPLIYTVYEVPAIEEPGQLSYATTILYPGKIGNEYYMTKGHYHSRGDTAEIYIGISGLGILLMQTPKGETETIKVQEGAVVYVPPYWAHRSVNTGKENFVFLAVYPADAGHNYGSIAKEGFKYILVEKNGRATLVEKP